jgi:lipoprotein-anchoring transpeptidase ErfK/SrfK
MPCQNSWSLHILLETGSRRAIVRGMKREQWNTLSKLAAAVAIAASDAYAEERRGDRIVVSIADRKLVLLDGDRLVKIYDVAVGKASTPSPEGEFRIINRIPNPAWYAPGKVVAPGKGNPLGSRWMGLSAKGYGIHGTNAPKSIGKAASHGCIRMRAADLEELFDLISVGVVVEIHGERPEILARIFECVVTE